MTIIPPLLGVIVFSYIIKFSGNEYVDSRVSIFQGVASYFSLVFTGFTYTANRHRILGIRFLIVLSCIIVIPIAIYGVMSGEVLVGMNIIFVFFFSNAVLYLLLIQQKIFYYLFFSIVNSTLLPCVLILSQMMLSAVTIFYFISFFLVIKNVFPLLSEFKIGEDGASIIKCIMFHGPYLLLPFFDFFIQSIIGEQNYNDYVFINKYINGGITLMFSYSQLRLIFSGELISRREILLLLLSLLLLSIGIVFIQNNYIYILLIAFCSLGINMGSLIIRNQLLKGISMIQALIGVGFVGIYVISIWLFRDSILSNNQLFILFMICCTILPSFAVLINKK